MKRFVIAFIGWHNNQLNQEVIEANSAIEAMVKKLHDDGWSLIGETFNSETDVQDFCFNCDHMISAYEIQ